jgi:hypothetical protein
VLRMGLECESVKGGDREVCSVLFMSSFSGDVRRGGRGVGDSFGCTSRKV